MKRYPLILQALSDFCDEYQLTQATRETYASDANRILESVVSGLTEEEILALMSQRGFEVEKSSYPSLIRILKELIQQRPRS
ncbi:hypothetical protein [Myxacorys almedinensis]|uniref:Uncharacterized protein n=1 Tax=Myxacorys almedinensis A TaxID=2690445 RepID=A0A8J7Z6G7_9CYAN|nr:hypothetical protein [Myxacorys almedinensis]NDJ16365.1 hypothetical protein [Myxacorys almedinensis A]